MGAQRKWIVESTKVTTNKSRPSGDCGEGQICPQTSDFEGGVGNGKKSDGLE